MADPASAAFRCSTCDVNWPAAPEYKVCPGCQKPTWRAERTEALVYGEAYVAKTEEFLTNPDAIDATLEAFLAETLTPPGPKGPRPHNPWERRAP